MSGKTITVWLSDEERNRYQRGADAIGVPLSTFLKRCADETLTPKDSRNDLRLFAADMRADLGHVMSKVVEAVALNAERDQQTKDDLRQIFDGFLVDLTAKQIDAVQKANFIGRQAGQAEMKEAIARKHSDPTLQQLGIRPTPTP